MVTLTESNNNHQELQMFPKEKKRSPKDRATITSAGYRIVISMYFCETL